VSDLERPTLDLARVAKLLGVAGSTEHAGEGYNAIQLVDRLLRAAGRTWPDLLKPAEELAIAVEAARMLLAENTAVKAENEQLRGSLTTAPARVDDWVPVGDPRAQAKWCLEQYAAQQIYLNNFERDFLGTIAGWRGELTVRQRPVFTRVIAQVTARSGRQPPA
jgi:hypothetical protein